MPRLIYKPEGGERKSWDFAFGKLMSPERVVIEKHTGLSWGEVQESFYKDSTLVIQAFLFVFLKREMPQLRISDVTFCDDDFEVDLTDAEAVESLAAVEANLDKFEDHEMPYVEAIRARVAEIPEDADPKAG